MRKNNGLAVALDTMGKKIHPVSYMNIAAFLQKADKERSGVISTMNSSLELWANPFVLLSVFAYPSQKFAVTCLF